MGKKRILVFPFDLLSHYLRCLVLVERYKEYEILFASSPRYNKYVTSQGHKTFEIETFDADHVMDCATKFSFEWLNIKDIERVFIAQANVIEKYQPEFIIGDAMPTLKMAAEYADTKYVALMNAYMSKHYGAVRRLSITHHAHEYLKKLPVSIGDKITVMAERAAFRSVHSPFRKLRSKYQLDKKRTFLDETEGDENFICDSTDIFPLKRLPQNYSVVGPLIHESNNDETELLSQVPERKPVICVCLGSSGNWQGLSFLSEKNYHHLTIITAGDINGVIRGPHVIGRPFVNLDQVLPICKLMICHGGNGTIYMGLRHNKYMLCYTNHFEQEWNVHQLVERGKAKHINGHPIKAVDRAIQKLGTLKFTD